MHIDSQIKHRRATFSKGRKAEKGSNALNFQQEATRMCQKGVEKDYEKRQSWDFSSMLSLKPLVFHP
ncbi:hypothetical protein MTR_6g088895 [Medicago truncatula]|uniref:Uncharacterized protein n=1 Tax=Medicago truncatula TaxID=3880 RepID=A0A072UMZ4_MEDTR|nr:hypothetical protein MTR_6g088895 [Medicago truncatula]